MFTARVTQKQQRPDAMVRPARPAPRPAEPEPGWLLQRQLGNSLLAALDGAPLPEAANPPGRPGRPLDPATRSVMESRFGHDFSGVRVHDGPAAARSADMLDADAYTVGQDVVLGADGYAPGTPAGLRLLAHELAHVVQRGLQPQPAAGPRRSSLSSAGAAEREAHAAAEAVSLGRPARVSERLALDAVARQPKGSSSRFSPAAESLTKEQIYAIWRQSKDISEFRFRLLGPVTDEAFYEFLSRKGFNPSETQAETGPAYTGPSIGPAPKGQQIVGRIIYFTHPEGGTIPRYMRGTPDELDQLQYEANLHAGEMMVSGLAVGLAGISAARGQGAPPATTERPAAAERRPAQPAPPAPTSPPRLAARPAPPNAPPTTAAPTRPTPPTMAPPTTAPPTTAPPTTAPPTTAPPTRAAPTATTTSTAAPPAPSPAAAQAPRAPTRGTQYVRGRMEVSDRRWGALRADALARDPTCAFCQSRGSVTANHVEPLVDADAIVDMGMMTREQAREAANDPSNLRGICRTCNSAKSGQPPATRRLTRAGGRRRIQTRR